MRIGIDLDGVIFDSEKLYRVYSELFDTCELKRNSIIDEQELKFQKRYNWTEEEKDLFIKKYHKKIVEESNFMPGVIEVLKMLKDEGNKFILITARGGISKEMIPITEKRLKDKHLDFLIENNLYDYVISSKLFPLTSNKDRAMKVLSKRLNGYKRPIDYVYSMKK